MIKSESIGKIAPALLKAQKEMGSAVKDAKNPFFKSKYADINSVREACHPSLNANGITVLQPTIEHNGKNYVETTLLHESGEFIGALTEIVFAKANDCQQQGSGISYARRYGLQSLLSLGTADSDGEDAMDRTPTFTPKQSTPVAAPIKKSSFKQEVPKPLTKTPSSAELAEAAANEGWE